MPHAFIPLKPSPQGEFSFAPDYIYIVYYCFSVILMDLVRSPACPVCSPLYLPCSLFSDFKDPWFGCLLGATTQVFACALSGYVLYIFVQKSIHFIWLCQIGYILLLVTLLKYTCNWFWGKVILIMSWSMHFNPTGITGVCLSHITVIAVFLFGSYKYQLWDLRISWSISDLYDTLAKWKKKKKLKIL